MNIIDEIIRDYLNDIRDCRWVDLSDPDNYISVCSSTYLKKLKDLILDNINFCGADLRGADFQGIRLQGANFLGADVRGAKFQGADVRGANFMGADLRGADFQGANLLGADFRVSTLGRNTNFENADLESANFEALDLTSANFEGVQLAKGQRDIKNLIENLILHQKEKYYKDYEVNFKKANLKNANFYKTSLYVANIRDTDLSEDISSTQRQRTTQIYTKANSKLYTEVEKLDKEISTVDGFTKIQSVLRSIAYRRGQSAFRQQLLKMYEFKCLITNCDAVYALEAAHIQPYSKGGKDINDISNGLLLRADIHTLFDLNLIAIDKDKIVHIHPNLRHTVYEEYDNKRLNLSPENCDTPNEQALKNRFEEAFKDLKDLKTLLAECKRLSDSISFDF